MSTFTHTRTEVPSTAKNQAKKILYNFPQLFNAQ